MDEVKLDMALKEWINRSLRFVDSAGRIKQELDDFERRVIAASNTRTPQQEQQ